MPEALADIFAAARTPQINWDGAPAYAIYEITPAPESLCVEFLRASAAPVQGLTIKISEGGLVINDIEAQEMVIWCDTLPGKISVRVKPRDTKTVTLKIWNVWRGSMGGVDVTQAWLGNSGMRIDHSPDGKELLLRCSDGEGSIDFGDLEARVVIA